MPFVSSDIIGFDNLFLHQVHLYMHKLACDVITAAAQTIKKNKGFLHPQTACSLPGNDSGSLR